MKSTTAMDERDILPALERAQDHAISLLSRQYQDPLKAYEHFNMVAGQREYPIPKDALEDRVIRVEIENNNLYYPLKPEDSNRITWLETRNSTSLPTHYVRIGKNIRLLPTANAAYRVRLWYLRRPPSLSSSEGQITKVGSNYVILDDVGENLSTFSDGNASYVNVIDSRNGEVVGALQIKRIDGQRIYFRDSPDRQTVNQTPIVTLADLKTNNGDPTKEVIKEDDFLCAVGTSCVPFMQRPLSNFLISYAEGEIRRKLGEETTIQVNATKQLMDDIKHAWSGRENTIKVNNNNPKWNMPWRRYYGTTKF
jgi:hypothetical protein